MRFMIMAPASVEAPAPTPARQAFHEQLARAGVLLDAGEFTLIEVRSREEALAWARRCPAPPRPAGHAGIPEVEVRSLDEPETIDRVRALVR